MPKKTNAEKESKRTTIYARVSDKRQAEADKTSMSEQIMEEDRAIRL